MSVAFWLLAAGVGVFTGVMVLSLCIMAAKPAPTPPTHGVRTLPFRPRTARGRPAAIWTDFRHVAAELQTGPEIGIQPHP
jgi:hypothetical protein